MAGITIGDDAVIGAKALVTRDVAPYAVVGDVPAKLIRYRFDKETIDILLRSEWWNWSEEKIDKYLPLFHASNFKADLLAAMEDKSL